MTNSTACDEQSSEHWEDREILEDEAECPDILPLI